MILTGKERYGEEFPQFHPAFVVAGCFVFCEDEMLLLLRHPEKPQGGTWGVPGGKVKPDERWSQAMRRELYEETHITASSLSYYGKAHVRYPTYDFVYAMFGLRLSAKPKLYWSEDEHTMARWVTPHMALTMPLIEDMDTCIKRVVLGQAA